MLECYFNKCFRIFCLLAFLHRLVQLNPSELSLLGSITSLDEAFVLLSTNMLLAGDNATSLVLNKVRPGQTTGGLVRSLMPNFRTASD